MTGSRHTWVIQNRPIRIENQDWHQTSTGTFHWASHCVCNVNKSAKGAYTWSSPVCLSTCEGSEYTCLSVTKRKIILNVTISKLLVLVSMSGIWFGVYINNISALVLDKALAPMVNKPLSKPAMTSFQRCMYMLRGFMEFSPCNTKYSMYG